MTDPLESDSEPKKLNPALETPPPVYDAAAPPAATSHKAPSDLFFPAMGQGKMSQKDEKFWGSLGHLLSLTGIFTGIGYIIGPLIPFFLKKGESPFVDEHAKETLNFSIVTVIAIFISGLGAVTSLPVLGCFAPMVPVLFVILNLIFCIQGASAARDGKAYRYPFNWRIIK